MLPPSGRRHRLELPVGQHVRSLPEASRVFLRGHHERASVSCHHGEGLPPQLTALPPTTTTVAAVTLSMLLKSVSPPAV